MLGFPFEIQERVSSLLTSANFQIKDVIYQTRETVFHRDIQTPRRDGVENTTCCIFDEIKE